MDTGSLVSEEVLRELEALLRDKRYQAFARRINETIQEHGLSASLCRLTASYASLTNDRVALRKALLQWASLAPADPEPLLQLACLLADRDSPGRALEALDLAEQTGSRPLEVSLCRVRLAILMHRFEDAACAARAGLVLAGQGTAEEVFLQGACILARNLQAAARRADLGDLVQAVVARASLLRVLDGVVVLQAPDGLKRPTSGDNGAGVADEAAQMLRQLGCGMVLSSAHMVDLARRLVKVQDGSSYGRRNRVYVLESDEDALALALAGQDASDLLADEAVTWLVGGDATGRFAQLLGERWGEPPVMLRVGVDTTLQPILDADLKARSRHTQGWHDQAEEYYRHLGKDHWADILGDHPSRPPRILLITTEFSSFMKFSIRDLAQAFEGMGWQARVVKESQATEIVHPLMVARAVAEFLPDVIWQINFMRNTWKGTIPDGVPFVCWDQDAMLHMMTAEQARAVSRFDFVAYLGSGLNYIRRYGYPRAQLVPLSMCVNASLFRPDPAVVVDTDVCYVSHHGSPPERRIRQALDTFAADRREVMRLVLQDYIARLESIFAAGRPLIADECRAMVTEVLGRQGLALDDKDLRNLNDLLYRLVVNTIWRQQAVRMVADRGVRLKLYGMGWEENPEFSSFAAGIVEHGQPLADVLRSSQVALQAALTGNEHQRLWEAAACGSIVLMRYHPGDEVGATLRRWLGRLEKGQGRHIDDVIPESDRTTMVGRAAHRFIRTGMADEDGIVTETVLECAQHAASTGCVFDKLGDVYEDLVFRNQEDLRSKLGRILENESHRSRLRKRLLEAAHNHKYEVQLPRVIRQMRQRLLA